MIRIMHVDDEQIDSVLLTMNFSTRSELFKITWFPSAIDALEADILADFDLIVSDYQMPEMNGLGFLKELRSRRIQLPFVFLSGLEDEKVIVESLAAGAADYYLKNDESALYERLHNSLVNHAKSYALRNGLEASRLFS